MKKLLTFIVKKIVTYPEEVEIKEDTDEEGSINLELDVHPEDMGLVIGKNGRVIRSLRNILKMKAIKEDVRVNLELIESDSAEE